MARLARQWRQTSVRSPAAQHPSAPTADRARRTPIPVPGRLVRPRPGAAPNETISSPHSDDYVAMSSARLTPWHLIDHPGCLLLRKLMPCPRQRLSRTSTGLRGGAKTTMHARNIYVKIWNRYRFALSPGRRRRHFIDVMCADDDRCGRMLVLLPGERRGDWRAPRHSR